MTCVDVIIILILIDINLSYSVDEFYGLYLCMCAGWIGWVQVGELGEWVWDSKVQISNEPI
jgi:hypothetical protein